jgi:hypothetical protein
MSRNAIAGSPGPTDAHQARAWDELLLMARAYRHWSAAELARALGREASALAVRGEARLDLVVRLADALDWPVQDVIAHLRFGAADSPPGEAAPPEDPRALREAARRASSEGRPAEAVELARAAYRSAGSPTDRAIACNREAVGWDGLGRYHEGIAATRRGLRERDASAEWRFVLRSNLACFHVALGQVEEASGLAQGLVGWFDRHPPRTAVERSALGTTLYVAGECQRRLAGALGDDAVDRAATALATLDRAGVILARLDEELGVRSYGGIANTCRAGRWEMEALLGQRDPAEVLARLTAGLDALSARDQPIVADWLESYGWWSVIGSNVALRHVRDEDRVDRYLAIFASVGLEVAERSGNWSMCERAWRIEHARRRGRSDEWLLDRDDVRAVVACMGGNPSFRATGWSILEEATLV